MFIIKLLAWFVCILNLDYAISVSFFKFLAPCKGIQDILGFWTPHRGFRIPGTKLQIFFSGTWIPDSNWQWDYGFLQLCSGFHRPGFQIPHAKISRIPESGFSYMARNFRYIHIQRHVKFMKRQRKIIHFTKKAPRGLNRLGLTSQVECMETVKERQNNRWINWKVIVQLLTTRSDEQSSFVSNKKCPTHINSPWYSRLN